MALYTAFRLGETLRWASPALCAASYWLARGTMVWVPEIARLSNPAVLLPQDEQIAKPAALTQQWVAIAVTLLVGVYLWAVEAHAPAYQRSSCDSYRDAGAVWDSSESERRSSVRTALMFLALGVFAIGRETLCKSANVGKLTEIVGGLRVWRYVRRPKDSIEVFAYGTVISPYLIWRYPSKSSNVHSPFPALCRGCGMRQTQTAGTGTPPAPSRMSERAEEPRRRDDSCVNGKEAELEADGAGGPTKTSLPEMRQARLAKKAESARVARLRHKSKVEEAQARLRGLRLKAAELQRRRSHEEAWNFTSLLDDIEAALPPERRSLFSSWVAEPRARAMKPPQDGDQWEPEVALFALSTSPRLSGLGYESPALSFTSSPAFSATDSPMLSAKISAFTLSSSPLAEPKAPTAMLMEPSPLSLGAPHPKAAQFDHSAPPAGTFKSSTIASALMASSSSLSNSALLNSTGSEPDQRDASPQHNTSPKSVIEGDDGAMSQGTAFRATSPKGDEKSQSVGAKILPSTSKVAGIGAEVGLPPIGTGLWVGSQELECAMGIIDLAVRGRM